MSEVGQVPVSMSKELPGFILNRIQYAILNECWRLVADDIVSAEDLDVVMKDGLGLRLQFQYNIYFPKSFFYQLPTLFSRMTIINALGMPFVGQWKLFI